MPYDVGSDPYKDAATGVLRNLLGIKTQEQLDEAEASLTAFEISAILLEGDKPPHALNGAKLKDIHSRLFSNIYAWAGELRTIELSKDNTSFARAAHLETNLHAIINELCADTKLDDMFVDRLAHYYGELIVLHPFREGNGRTIRTFLTLLAERYGWHIAWDLMDPQANIVASIAAYQGDEEPLRMLLRDIISRL